MSMPPVDPSDHPSLATFLSHYCLCDHNLCSATGQAYRNTREAALEHDFLHSLCSPTPNPQRSPQYYNSIPAFFPPSMPPVAHRPSHPRHSLLPAFNTSKYSPQTHQPNRAVKQAIHSQQNLWKSQEDTETKEHNIQPTKTNLDHHPDL